jgi:hypothetical protein
MLVLLADVVFLREVDEEDDWLGSEQEERVDGFDLGDDKPMSIHHFDFKVEVV